MGLLPVVSEREKMTATEQQWKRYRRDFEAFLKLEKGMAGNSIDAYLHDYAHLSRYMISKNIVPDAVTIDNLKELLKEVNDLEVAATTQRRMIAGWRMFFKMLVIEDIIKDNPAELLDLPVRVKLLPDVLTDEESTKLQSTLKHSG